MRAPVTLVRAGGLALLASTLACSAPGPTGPSERIRAFGPADRPITQTSIAADEGGWRVTRDGSGSVPLFEVADPGTEQAVLTYRARIKAADVTGQAYLEMWVRLPGRGEFFSRGLHQPVRGTADWASYEIPFFLKQGERPDLVKLNVAFDGGGGTLWIKDIELLRSGLSG